VSPAVSDQNTASGEAPKRVAVAVPVLAAALTDEARVSLRHLLSHLGAHEVYAVCPEDVAGSIPELPAKPLAARWFRSRAAYSRLLLREEFYALFAEYVYLLVYQLDCLVFRDELLSWCDRGFDYVGAPWTRTAPDGTPYFTGVGNGGLSLRRVASFRRLAARSGRRLGRALGRGRILAARAAAAAPRGPGAVRLTLAEPYPYEDKFWSLEAPKLDPSFRIPPPELAVSFSFETEPRFCFEANGRRLPFGCHAWAAHDRAFWEPHLLREAAG
jgi:Protein of unknown function (DUF5672)